MNIKKLAAAAAVAAGLVAVGTGTGAAAVSHAASPAGSTATVHHAATVSTTQPKAEPEQTGKETAAQSDGPGGHQDAAGQNVDHQFNGAE